MKWPWVSRLAFELLERENERLNARLDQLIDHRKRLERVGSGIREEPASARRKRSDQIPQELRDLIAGYESSAVQAVIYDEVRGAFAEGQDWDEITARIRAHLIESQGGREDA